MRIFPIWNDFFSPIFAQVLPPSMLLYTPSPYETELRGLASPVPTQTRSGFVWHTATSPIETVVCVSNRWSNVVPLFTVFNNPPDAVAT